MPRKSNQAPGLGRMLIKDRFGRKKVISHMHASELSAEHEDLNLKSVTELTSLDDFLATAEMAGTEFSAQKMNIRFVDSDKHGVLSAAEKKEQEKAYEEFQHLLGIPRRPEWNESMTKEELDLKERNAFLAWRRQLATVQENKNLLLTPYEKNLDFWRQLWRVIERSDVIVQIVDARTPLLFRCEDLETYVKQVSPSKQNMILVNKADLLSAKQRQSWKKYFDDHDVTAVFWSAVLENEKLELENKKKRVTHDVDDHVSDNDDESKDEDDDSDNDLLLSRLQLIDYLKGLVDKDSKVIGMVGYPNVGKSSSVNTLLGIKKVAVSATPGRTKHFQTLHVDSELCLCDCPGLVFPSFVSSKSEMVLSGILPIDQMRDHVGPVNLLSTRVPRAVIEGTYGINIPRPKEGEDPNRPPTSVEILSAHALSRGFMTSHGQPDNSRSARIILKDYVNGKLLYSVPPPGFNESEYKSWSLSKVEIVLATMAGSMAISEDLRPLAARIERVNKKDKVEVHDVEKEFFRPQTIRTFTNSKEVKQTLGEKKRRNKKRDKTRRVRTVVY